MLEKLVEEEGRQNSPRGFLSEATGSARAAVMRRREKCIIHFVIIPTRGLRQVTCYSFVSATIAAKDGGLWADSEDLQVKSNTKELADVFYFVGEALSIVYIGFDKTI